MNEKPCGCESHEDDMNFATGWAGYYSWCGVCRKFSKYKDGQNPFWPKELDDESEEEK